MIDPIDLARIQFAANISFHILFPTITIALGWILLFFKLRFRATGDEKWMVAYGFWVKVFALSFAMGVVSGVTMSFQFGTNWPGYMMTVGNIAGPLLAYEVLTAFFLEASFLAVMLFGRDRVSDRMHTIATLLVAGGTTLSAFWILALNSWMQTPAGFEMINGQAHPTSWWEVVFNPSFPYRLAHMLIASGLTASFLVAGLSAYKWLRGDRSPAVMAALRTGVYLAAMLIPVQIFVGDLHGLNVGEHQPVKLAAMEAHWRSEPPGHGVPLILFAVPNEREERNDYEVAIPKLGSLILTHTLDGDIQPLTAVPREERPPVAPVFYAFRIMVGLGMAMLLLTLASLWAWKRKTLFTSRWLLDGWRLLAPSGFIALLAGWYVVEIGRQPYVVYGLLRTADAVSPNIVAAAVLSSLIVYAAAYAFVFGAGIWYLQKLLRKGPVKQPPKDTEGGEKTPARPMSLPDERIDGGAA